MYNNYLECIKTNLNLSEYELNFKSNTSYTDILEHVSHEQSEQYLTIIMNIFYNLYTSNKDYLITLCHENDLYGKPNKTTLNNFTECSPTNLRYILHSFLILNYINSISLNNLNIIEIGGGYGGLCFFINNIAHLFNVKINTYTIFDLEEASLLQKKYIKNIYKKDNVKFYQIDNFENLSNNSFLISNYAFSEISMSLQEEYTTKILNPYVSYGFLVWNNIPVYNFIENKVITKEEEFPLTASNNYYVRFR